MICGKTLREGISNEANCFMTGMEKIEKFLKEQRLQWLGHVERAPEKAKNFAVEGLKKGKLKKRWKDVVEKYLLVK